MSKTFLVWLNIKNGSLFTTSSMWSMKIDDLRKNIVMLPEYTEEYNKFLKASPFYNWTKPELENELKRRGMPYSSRPKEGMIMELTLTDKKPEPDAADDQLKVIKSKDSKILVHAGPGAGKTTTLCAYIHENYENNRILFLVYTIAAKNTIKEKLKRRRISVVSKDKIYSDVNGVFVLTFDEYSSRRISSTFSDETYRDIFQKGIKKGRCEWEKWDILVIDEVQDVLLSHETIINQISDYCGKIVLAGDPRQELYTNATYMTKLWSSDTFSKYTLRYNHRSSKKIVDMLNVFSKFHFGDLHVDQISTQDNEGEIYCEIAKSIDNISELAAESLYSKESFCISPVSIKKFHNTNTIVTKIRQEISNLGGPLTQILINDLKFNPNEKIIYIGTSYKLKGTEKDNVVLIQSDIPYDDIIVPRENLKRLMYVALSRARNSISIILSSPLNSEGMLGCISHILQVPTHKIAHKKVFIPKHINSVDDMTTCNLKYSVEDEINLPALPYVSKPAPDFLGNLIEGVLARKLGSYTPREYELRIFHENQQSVQIFIEGQKWILSIPKRLEHFIVPNLESEYFIAMMKYTICTNTLWTLGDEFRDCEFDELDNYVAKIPTGEWKRECYREIPIIPHRSCKILGQLRTITDVESEDTILEVKHTGDTVNHYRQLLTYILSTNIESGILANTRNGFIKTIRSDLSSDKFNLFMRGCLMMKQAKTARVKVHNPMSFNTFPDMVIALDIENYKDNIFEIGAIAFSRSTYEILDVFHVVSEPATECRKTTAFKFDLLSEISKMCGMNVDETKNDTKKFLDQFQTWRKNLDEEHILIHWAGNESEIFGGDTCNLHKMFKVWLERNSMGRKLSLSLTDAVSQIFGLTVFEPHRAYEDAVATMGVFVAIQ